MNSTIVIFLVVHLPWSTIGHLVECQTWNHKVIGSNLTCGYCTSTSSACLTSGVG